MAKVTTIVRNKDYRALLASDLLSTIGDQMARVALSVLVFHRTGSPALTGIAYAATFVPSTLSGLLFGWVADRYPRRMVMVVTDLARALFAAIMAIPGLSSGWLIVLVSALTFLNPLFKGAQTASVNDALPEESEFKLAQALRFGTIQGAQLCGFAIGGIIANWNPAICLLLNSVSFVASAFCVSLVTKRPAKRKKGDPSTGGIRLFVENARLRAALLMSLVLLAFIVPEAVAVPLASALGAPGWAGILLAAGPVGAVLGTLLLRIPAIIDNDDQVMAPAAIIAALGLVGCWFTSNIVVVVALFVFSGAAWMVTMTMATNFLVLVVQPENRGYLGGIVTVILGLTQGAGALLGGAVAGATSPAAAVGLAGLAAIAIAVMAGFAWRNANSRETSADVVR